jgi:hypothetical protein
MIICTKSVVDPDGDPLEGMVEVDEFHRHKRWRISV